MEINDHAPVVTRDEILVRTHIERIWSIQTDVVRWPEWQPDIERAQAEGPLAVGVTFHWRTFGMDIASTVEEIDAPGRIAWGGPSSGIVGRHVWTFASLEDAVLVRTEESWEGSPVEAQRETMQASLDRSLRTWLESLKRRAEEATE